MIKVGISEYKTATELDVLSCVGLGSCVGLCLYDPFNKSGGLAHILLPDSSHAKSNDSAKPGKFADTAVEALLSKMEKEGSSKKNIRAKMVGGASMFSSDTEANGIFTLGPKNVKAVKNALYSTRIMIAAEDTGGTQGRTIEFHVGSGKVTIKTMTGTIEI